VKNRSRRFFQTSITRKAGSGDAVISRTVDGHGNILTETDPNLNETTFTYDAHDRLLTESGPSGSGRILSYDDNGNVVSETVLNSTGNQVTSHSYDLANRLSQSTLPEGGIISYSYDDNDNIIVETKPNGYQATYSYNNLNLPTSKQFASGSGSLVWNLDYDNAGNLISEDGPHGQAITYTYDALNREETKTDVFGLVKATTYDADSNIKTETDGNGTLISHTYNALHQRTKTTQPLSRSHDFTYTLFDELKTDTGPNGTITHIINQLGRKTRSQGPDNFNVLYGYDRNGNLTSETDSKGITTTHVINGLNQTTSSTRAGFTQIFTYDTVGNLLTETDYRGIVTDHSYDKENRRTETIRAGVRQKSTTYNKAGLPVIETDANGFNTVHEYNNQYHKIRTIRPENQVIGFTPNAYGDVVAQDNPGPNDIVRIYDERRRLTSKTNGANETTQYEYDGNNNRTAVIKPEGNRWEYDFDVANRLTHVRNVPEAIETIYTYDAADNLKTITDAENKVTEFDYDDRNRKTSKTYPGETAVIDYDYDANSNLTDIDLPNGTHITYTYDDLNRQTNQSYTGTYGTASVTYTLDGNGNIEQVDEVIDGQAYVYAMAYDDFDRMERKTDRYGNSFDYSYDANGNRKVFKDQTNQLTSYTYDKLNRLEQMTNPSTGAFDWSYNSAGLPDQLDYPNGSQANYTYDNANRIDVIDNKQSGVTVTQHDYDYDLNGNRIKLTESNIDAAQITSYDYDEADRLVKVYYPTTINSYTLDKVGNRELEIIDTGGVLTTRDYGYNNRDQLKTITDDTGLDVSYDYDAAGNQTEKTENGVTTVFDYSARQRVKSITIGAQSPIEYQYDHSGQRINQQNSGTEKRYLYDGLSLIAETNTLGNTIARYHYGIHHQLAETRNSQSAFYLNDSLGTTVAITNQDGSIQNRMDYDVWGNLNQETATSESPFGFIGYIKDDDTDLYYANARYYDSFTGRFLREDPLQGKQNTPPSLHRYLYAYANPTVYIDPDGRETTIPDLFQRLNYSPTPEAMIVSTAVKHAKIGSEHKKRQEALNQARLKAVKDEQMMRVAEPINNATLLEYGFDEVGKSDIIKSAHLVNCAYNPNCEGIDENIGNIKRLNEKELREFGILKERLTHFMSGFEAAIFRDLDNSKVHLSFVGTNDTVRDGVLTDIGQGAGVVTLQHKRAWKLAKDVALIADKLGLEMELSGHSLGGGLAETGSIATGKKAYTYNAAGVHPFTINSIVYEEIMETGEVPPIYESDRLVNAFYVEGEVLSWFQDSLFFVPSAGGRRIPLKPATSDGFFLQHGSTKVCKSLGSNCNY
jgi:RHS repeat-associated protein